MSNLLFCLIQGNMDGLLYVLIHIYGLFDLRLWNNYTKSFAVVIYICFVFIFAAHCALALAFFLRCILLFALNRKSWLNLWTKFRRVRCGCLCVCWGMYIRTFGVYPHPHKKCRVNSNGCGRICEIIIPLDLIYWKNIFISKQTQYVGGKNGKWTQKVFTVKSTYAPING